MKKIEFRKYYDQLKDNPGKIFGLVYIYIFIIGLFFGIHYVDNISAVARWAVPRGLPDTTAQQELQVVEARTIDPINLSLIEKPDQQMLDNGKSLYASACASCHGETGAGDGPAGVAINPPPKNLRVNEGWKNGPSMSQLYKTLEEGIPGTAMISYNYMPPEDRVALSHYMRQNFIPNPPAVTQNEIQDMDQTYALSGGGEISAQIPVSSAMEIYMRENRSRTQRIINSIRELSEKGTEGASLFDRVTNNRTQAVTSLVMHDEWLKDRNKLRSLMTSGINRNGFNSEVFYLDDDEWNKLHNYLASIF
jgi:mono/diheme cytochrome c family protein